jgi:hypothetical protein
LPRECRLSQARAPRPSAVDHTQGTGRQPQRALDASVRAARRGPDSNGHGLGLVFVEVAVRAHGGKVTASNREEGRGQFTVSLPLASCMRDFQVSSRAANAGKNRAFGQGLESAAPARATAPPELWKGWQYNRLGKRFAYSTFA